MHFESIEYSQEISEENPETIEAFDQFIRFLETEEENTIQTPYCISWVTQFCSIGKIGVQSEKGQLSKMVSCFLSCSIVHVSIDQLH